MWVWGQLNERLRRPHILQHRLHSNDNAQRMRLLTRVSAVHIATLSISSAIAYSNYATGFFPIYNEKQTIATRVSNPGSDSAKPHLPIGYAADLTPVVAAKGSRASWNASGMAGTVWKGLIFRVARNTGTGRRGGHLERLWTRRRTRAAKINWYWVKERRTSRLSVWRTHERSRIFGGRGCGLGGGRRPGTGYRPETGSWSAPPGPSLGGRRGV